MKHRLHLVDMIEPRNGEIKLQLPSPLACTFAQVFRRRNGASFERRPLRVHRVHRHLVASNSAASQSPRGPSDARFGEFHVDGEGNRLTGRVCRGVYRVERCVLIVPVLQVAVSVRETSPQPAHLSTRARL